MAKSAATDAPGLSAATSSTGGAVSSSRSRSAQGHRGDDAALQHAWTVLGLPERYVAPDEQEIKDLADRRHQKRGKRKRKRRLEANWKLYEREAQHAEAAQPEVAAGPALPAYLLERGEAIRPAAANAPTYIDVAALRARLQPSTAAQQDGDLGESAIVCAFSPTELMYHLCSCVQVCMITLQALCVPNCVCPFLKLFWLCPTLGCVGCVPPKARCPPSPVCHLRPESMQHGPKKPGARLARTSASLII